MSTSQFTNKEIADYVSAVMGGAGTDAEKAATINAADLLGIKGKTGSIVAGKKADIIAVITNPIDDITILEQVQFVMKNGVVYKNN